MSPSLSVLGSVFRRGVIAAAVVVACGSTMAVADTVIRSNGSSNILALSASSLASSTTINYDSNGSNFGNTWQFAKFAAPGNTGSPFLANGAPAGGSWVAAQTVAAATIPTRWNNPGNSNNGWTSPSGVPNSPNSPTDLATMNGGSSARWISNSTSAQPTNNPTTTSATTNRPTSVLFAIPINHSPSATLSRITLTFVSDNGLGNTMGANNAPNGGFGINTGATPGASSTFVNSGVFINGVESAPAVVNSGGFGDPQLYRKITTITFNPVLLAGGNNNWLYLHQFNWGTFGGSAFTVSVATVPLPAPVWGGMAGLAGVGCIAAVRRRRMA